MKITHKKLIFVLIIAIITVGIGGYVYNKTHYVNINGIRFNRKTESGEIEKILINDLNNKKILFKNPDGVDSETSLLKDVFIISFDTNEIADALNNTDSYYIKIVPSIENMDTSSISLFDAENACIKKNSEWFYMDEEKSGQKLNIHNIPCCLLEKNPIIVKEEIKPTITKEDLSERWNEIDKYKSFSISYDNGYTFSKNDLYKYMSISNNKLFIDIDGATNEILTNMKDSYNTVGDSYSFCATNAGIITAKSITYGSEIDTEKETAFLKDAIKNGNSIFTRTPEKINHGMPYHDDFSTYIEISIEKQHLWYYKNHTLVLDSDIVTGKANKHDTPKGIYYITEKKTNKTMRGKDYVSHADRWMRLTGDGIGLHDASWRSRFGGNIYKSNGSHGCVNLPVPFAYKLYDELDVETPVIIY